MKKLLGHIKAFVDIWKVWIFFAALLFGTNGAQFIANSEPQTEELTLQRQTSPEKPTKTIIIHKSDNEYVDRKLEEHKTGAQH